MSKREDFCNNQQFLLLQKQVVTSTLRVELRVICNIRQFCNTRHVLAFPYVKLELYGVIVKRVSKDEKNIMFR